MLLLLVLIVVQSGVHHKRKKKNNVDKHNSDGPDARLPINQNQIWKEFDESEENDDDTIAIITEHQGLKSKLKDN